jgi:hypothetical protein
VTVSFVPEVEETRVTVQMVFPSEATREHVIQKYGAAKGPTQTLALIIHDFAGGKRKGALKD